MPHRILAAVSDDFIVGAATVVPPGTVTGALVLGLPLKDWAIAVTIAYTLFMLAFGAWKWRREYLRAKREDEAHAKAAA